MMKKILGSIVVMVFLFSCKSSIVDGYTDHVSYSHLDSISIYLNANKTEVQKKININDINGNVVHSLFIDVFPQIVHNNEPYKNGFKYLLSAKIPVPKLKSGVYLFENKIPFIIRPEKPCDILILYSSNTENAYANSGGKSLYGYNSTDEIASHIVSFRRPIDLPAHSTQFLQWIARQGLDVGYISDQDMDDYSNLSSSKLLIVPGHSEYWTRQARENFDRFIDEGKNALILSGNTMWWQVRYDSVENRMICYKDASLDPETNPLLKTITWPDSSLKYSTFGSIGLDFNLGGYGKKSDNGWDGYKIVLPNSPLLKGSGLKFGDVIHLPSDEYDGAFLAFTQDSSSVSLVNPLNFFRYELIGYDLASRLPESNGAWIVLQRNANSGVLINTGSTDWCSTAGMDGENSKLIKTITLNMIDLLLKNDKRKLFSKLQG